jgi:hypothetical protein
MVAVFGEAETTANVGAPGIVFGVTATDAVEVSEVNSAFSAVTVNV